jgi:hypothetical protein
LEDDVLGICTDFGEQLSFLGHNFVITTLSANMRVHERILVLIEQPPWSAIYRIGIGCMMLPLFYRLFGKDDPGWYLVLWFIGVLCALRLLPVVFRKGLPFSREVRDIWIERRQTAKSFDSYQWRKLIWFGIGLAVYVVLSGNSGGIVDALIVFCILCGGVGVLIWRQRATVGGNASVR